MNHVLLFASGAFFGAGIALFGVFIANLRTP